ncbi:MAG TPA: hypothetical protein VKM55_01920 [Candidatus Lokiarchaeia archaeon]|nr:hypothetical protein [Candidatus Lokiarchaeia archaeon]
MSELPRASDSTGQHLDGIPALVYTAFWQHKIDGRFRKATKGISESILFDFIDYRPAALMTIDDGDYTVTPVADPEKLARKPDASVRGRMADATQLLNGLGAMIKALFTGTIKLKGIRKLYLLVKILQTKEVD